jgi:hypothetical protein
MGSTTDTPPFDSDHYREALIQTKVEHAIAPWRGKLPAFMVDNLREKADGYYRTHPFAIRVITMLVATAVRAESAVTGGVAPSEAPPGREEGRGT